ncbi:uncharacterized protein LOC143533480 [Bidens hawaiensis]|uniref:uncharacterized protein LOC143533480 n=1 Tax=Bidens hawaiensis TaxID=980011 RepID=UPI0040493A8F
MFTQNNQSVTEYYHKLNIMWKQLDQILQLPSCTCDASQEFNNFNHLIKLMQFLMGLDNSYESVRTALLLKEVLPTVKDAFAIVSREESHRNSSNGSLKGQTQGIGFASKSNQAFEYKRNSVRTPNQGVKCTHCNKMGHSVEKCFEIVGYPPWMKPRNNVGKKITNNLVASDNPGSSNSSSATGFTPDQITRLLGLLNDKSGGSDQSCNMSGFINKECPGDW